MPYVLPQYHNINVRSLRFHIYLYLLYYFYASHFILFTYVHVVPSSVYVDIPSCLKEKKLFIIYSKERKTKKKKKKKDFLDIPPYRVFFFIEPNFMNIIHLQIKNYIIKYFIFIVEIFS